jgi:hypothetical protein
VVRYEGQCEPATAAVSLSVAPGYAALASRVHGVKGWEKVVASCGWLYVWFRRCAVLAAQAHACLSGLIDAYPDDICKWICMFDMEVFGSESVMTEVAFNGTGVMLFMDEAFTARRLRLWAACAEHGRKLAQLRRSMSTHDEFSAFCAAADSYFGGVLRQQVCVALEKAIGL